MNAALERFVGNVVLQASLIGIPKPWIRQLSLWSQVALCFYTYSQHDIAIAAISGVVIAGSAGLALWLDKPTETAPFSPFDLGWQQVVFMSRIGCVMFFMSGLMFHRGADIGLAVFQLFDTYLCFVPFVKPPERRIQVPVPAFAGR